MFRDDFELDIRLGPPLASVGVEPTSRTRFAAPQATAGGTSHAATVWNLLPTNPTTSLAAVDGKTGMPSALADPWPIPTMPTTTNQEPPSRMF
ncbi:hypothetical protein [Kutzneria sp. NPDC052558]|uniref:hypothetical protein n=1 Tax=Kutzneria sp. NPDC052558 TaxID=3364121 RepID=UPI0037CBB66F